MNPARRARFRVTMLAIGHGASVLGRACSSRYQVFRRGTLLGRTLLAIGADARRRLRRLRRSGGSWTTSAGFWFWLLYPASPRPPYGRW
jgi:hypothetical protein